MNENEKNLVLFIKIEKQKAQKFLQKINTIFKNDLIINQKIQIIKDDNYIFFPLVDDHASIDQLASLTENEFNFEIISKKGIFDPSYKHKTIQEALLGKIPAEFNEFIPKSYDILGDIAIIEFKQDIHVDNEKIESFKNSIASAVIEVNKNVVSVFEKKSKIKGAYRLRELKLLAGENKSETIHKENNCIFKLDVKNTFFTPRLVFERKRIASQDFKEGEMIIDLFAGVGPFSIQIAKNNRVNLFSFDINPKACDLMVENVKINKLKGKINVHHFDVRTIMNKGNKIGTILKNKADRIIMNLPERSLEFIDVACFLLKESGGIIHNYQFSEKPDPIKKALDSLKQKLNENDFCMENILNSKIVKTFSPKSELVVVDLVVKKK